MPGLREQVKCRPTAPTEPAPMLARYVRLAEVGLEAGPLGLPVEVHRAEEVAWSVTAIVFMPFARSLLRRSLMRIARSE